MRITHQQAQARMRERVIRHLLTNASLIVGAAIGLITATYYGEQIDQFLYDLLKALWN